jgi:hypothetical protein
MIEVSKEPLLESKAAEKVEETTKEITKEEVDKEDLNETTEEKTETEDFISREPMRPSYRRPFSRVR